MALTRVRLADGALSCVSQICLTAPEELLTDGRIIPFLSRLPAITGGGSNAWELLLYSAAGPEGVQLRARLITHTRLAHSAPQLADNAARTAQDRLLQALTDTGIPAHPADDRIAPPRAALTCLCKRGAALLPADAFLPEGQLAQRLCAEPGNGLSLLLTPTEWRSGEPEALSCGISAARRTQLAADPVFRFALTLWGAGAQRTAAWLETLSQGTLTAAAPPQPRLYPLCMRSDPWQLMALCPDDARPATLLTLNELLTLCGCPAEPGDMQRMCRSSWRDEAHEALTRANLSFPTAAPALPPSALTYLGLQHDSDLTGAMQLSAGTAEMLRMCVMILHQLGVMQLPGDAPPGNPLMSYLLPTVGHIYEQLVRECCYRTMYLPYYAYATGRKPRQITGVILSTYDQGPGCRQYALHPFPEGMTEPQMQLRIREQMISDFTAYATVSGHQMPGSYWLRLFSDMGAVRSQRNEMAHEAASLDTAAVFTQAFLMDRPGEPSLLRRLLACRWIETHFPAP